MEHYKERAKIVAQEMIADDVYSMLIQTESIAAAAKAGQFVSLYTDDGAKLLPRPISICDVEGNVLRLVYRRVGSGTTLFSKYTEGDSITVMGPLGNGYSLAESDALLVAGGIGIPPMVLLAKSLKENKPELNITTVLGFRNSDTFLVEELSKYSKVIIATDDGSLGIKGNVIDAIKQSDIKAGMIYSCGPTPMLKGVQAYSKESGIPAQISLEERMACGIGACLACVCKTKEVDSHSHVHNARICKDGPVFFAEEVEL